MSTDPSLSARLDLTTAELDRTKKELVQLSERYNEDILKVKDQMQQLAIVVTTLSTTVRQKLNPTFEPLKILLQSVMESQAAAVAEMKAFMPKEEAEPDPEWEQPVRTSSFVKVSRPRRNPPETKVQVQAQAQTRDETVSVPSETISRRRPKIASRRVFSSYTDTDDALTDTTEIS